LSATVDLLNLIHESDEGDNYDAVTINVLGSPDMAVQPADIAVERSPPSRMCIHHNRSVRNLGDDAPLFNVSFYDGGVLIGRQTISNLPQGTIGTVSVTWGPTTPQHVITVVWTRRAWWSRPTRTTTSAEEVNVGAYPDLTIT
jgi:subtilase family serine protease